MLDEVWLAMEYLEGGTLQDALRNCAFDEPSIAYVAGEILKGIHYLHSNQWIHRDLKSSNIMLTTSSKVGVQSLIEQGQTHRLWALHPCRHYQEGQNVRFAVLDEPRDAQRRWSQLSYRYMELWHLLAGAGQSCSARQD